MMKRASDVPPPGDRRGAAGEIASRYSATVVLKGAGTVVVSSDGAKARVNETGNPFMALGGAGDLLAGAIGARWAYLGKMTGTGNGERVEFLAAASAAWLHGAAADKVVAEGRDPSIAAFASAMGELRVRLDAGSGGG